VEARVDLLLREVNHLLVLGQGHGLLQATQRTIELIARDQGPQDGAIRETTIQDRKKIYQTEILQALGQ
jgi:hypothetical protein